VLVAVPELVAVTKLVAPSCSTTKINPVTFATLLYDLQIKGYEILPFQLGMAVSSMTSNPTMNRSTSLN